MRHQLALALTVAFAAHGAQAATSLQTFDTPTANLAQTMATYGVTPHGQLDAVVADGMLRLDPVGGGNAHLSFGSFAGDVVFEFDAGIETVPGRVNVGYYIGASHFFHIHPGLWGNYFFTGGGTPSGNLGFTPTTDLTHFRLAITAATRQIDLTLSSGGNNFHLSYVDPLYEPGVSVLGFTVGAVEGPMGLFDNLAITTPAVPEPGSALLLGIGLAMLAQRRLRHAVV